MSKNSNTFAMLFGAAAGVALGYWLNTENGKKFRKDATATLENASAQARATLEEKIESGKVMMDNVSQQAKDGLLNKLEAGKEIIHDISEKAKGGIEGASKLAIGGVEKVESNFEKGANRAKRDIESFDQA